ncbi:MAG: peptidoglycan DD-metalloendopeptidase family protein, partial [Anaerolineales bacterium]
PPPADGIPPNPEESRFGEVIIVRPNDPGFTTGKHHAEAEFQTFQGTWNWSVKYIETQPRRSRVWGRWVPRITRSGFYEVSVFAPARHSTTENARYKLHGVVGNDREIVIPVAQADYFNLWVPLGIYEFDAANPHAGIVFLNDLTGETGKTIAFDAVRFRELLGDADAFRYVADGFDPPIGTQAERTSDEVWPGHWIDATGYAVRYFRGTPAEAYHTGADLNLNRPYFDADRDAPIYAAADGTVIFSGRLPGWGWIINVRHDPLVSTGEVVYTRYAHVNDARVEIGDRVVRGQQIANVGNAEGNFAYHLHFDVVTTDVLERNPGDWPKLNLNRVLANYVDPQAYIAGHRPPR